MPPIKPSEIKKIAPEAVYDCFNFLIAQQLTGNNDTATVLQSDVVKMLVEKGFSEKEIIDKRMLDIEDEYRKAGWEVEYDKPAFNEDHPYPPRFKFRSRKNSRY